MIIPFIRTLYTPSSSLPEDLTVYKTVLEDIEFFAVAPQVYQLLLIQGQLQQTPSFFQDQLKQSFTNTLYQNLLIKSQTEQIFYSFEKLGIPVIPIKGVFFAETYFGHLGARWTSDIDLLIRKTDLSKAVEGVKVLGFTVEEDQIKGHFHWSFSKPLPGSPIPLTVELHWDLLKENTSSLNMDRFWNQSVPYMEYKHVRELSDYHTFYMICLHGWKHHLNSLKYFLDIMQMISVLANKIDYPAFLREAAEDKTLRRIVRVLSIVYSVFPQLNGINEFPFARTESLGWDYRALRDPQYKSFRQYMNLFRFSFLDFDTFSHSLAAVSNWILPSQLEVSFELGSYSNRQGPPALEYFKLYRKRCSSLISTLWNQ